jgi:DNA replication and repair protein RecF
VTALTRLSVDGFRNLAAQAIDLDPGVNLVVGDNGQGKTNLLEAIYLLAYQLSFRTGRVDPLITAGRDEAVVRAEVANDSASTIALRLPRVGRRTVLVDGKPGAPGITLAAVPIVLFAPTDLVSLRGAGAERRGLLDRAIAVQWPDAVATMRTYRRLLRQRNELLRRAREVAVSDAEHRTWERQLAAAAVELWSVRRRFVAAWQEVAGPIFHEISAFPEHLSIRYNVASGAPRETPPADPPLAVERLRDSLAHRRSQDLRTFTTSVGPHRDDFSPQLGELPCRQYASQGQLRAVAIALRMAQVELYRRDHGTIPILLLDELFAEFDERRGAHMATTVAAGGGQAVIAAVGAERLDRWLPGARHFRVHRGVVVAT